MHKLGLLMLAGVVPSLVLAGCQSPYRADQGALFGGLTGAGVGALVGQAVGKPLAGAAIGAGVGTLSGAAVGASLDDIEARNRAEIEARTGRPYVPGAVTITDVVQMSHAGISDETIANQVRNHGTARMLQTEDVMYLKNSGVSERVIQAMQQAPIQPMVVGGPPPSSQVVVEEHYYHDPWWGPPYPRRYYGRPYHRPRPGVSWGMSFSN